MPVSPAGLADALKPFGESRVLPPAGCIDPAFFSWEQKYFFGGGWTCVGFCAELAHRADQRAESIGDGSVLLSRDDDGVLRAFAKRRETVEGLNRRISCIQRMYNSRCGRRAASGARPRSAHQER